MKSKVIAVTNQKGGVGKTTTTANLAYALTKKGHDVLLIDFDSQASLTNYLNVGIGEDEDYYGIYEMMLASYRQIDEDEDPQLAAIDMDTEEGFAQLCRLCICRPTYQTKTVTNEDGTRKVVDVPVEFGFDLLPSHLNLADFELEISSLRGKEAAPNGFRLYNLVQRILNWHAYDYVLIDCNPSLGVMAMNAITAAVDGVLVPTNLDLMSTRGVTNLINKVVDVQEMLLKVSRGEVKHMGIIGIVLNLYAERRSVDRTIQNDLSRFYPFKIFASTIPESVNAKKALFAGVLYSQLYKKAEVAYDALAGEVEQRLAEMQAEGQLIQRFNGGLAEGTLEEDDDE